MFRVERAAEISELGGSLFLCSQCCLFAGLLRAPPVQCFLIGEVCTRSPKTVEFVQIFGRISLASALTYTKLSEALHHFVWGIMRNRFDQWQPDHRNHNAFTGERVTRVLDYETRHF